MQSTRVFFVYSVYCFNKKSVLSGSPLPDEEIDNILGMAALQMDDMIAEISGEGIELSNFTIDHFIEQIVRRQFPMYKMQPTQYTQFPYRYVAAPSNQDDIQIIYANHHYIVSHCRAGSNEVNVYDSLYHNGVISPEARQILQKFYPGKRFYARRTATRQPDTRSCGVFAIANVTSLLLGQNPGNYRLLLEGMDEKPDITMRLRTHLVQIFTTDTITLFPTTE